jgi:hypothetical protein
MIDYVETLLHALRPAFSRRATFAWFVIAFLGFVMRTDTYGVSSIIRALFLSPHCYPCLIHFFHSSAWNTQSFLVYWWKWVIAQKVAYLVNDRVVFTGDHTKNVKDGRKIPEVETLHQDSETASKPSYFRGHHWGCIGLLTNAGKKFFSTPLWAEIHCSMLEERRSTRIVSMAVVIARTIGRKGYLVLDAFFAVGPVFQIVHNLNDACMHILTRSKKNVVAYLPAGPKEKGKRGRTAIYGEKLKLMNLFDVAGSQFSNMEAHVYEKSETIRYLVLDLLWKPVKGTLRFILIESSHGRIILMTSDLELNAETALFLYCRRVSIEILFDSLKNLLGGLRYHFWSKYLQPSSRRPIKKNTRKPISTNPEKTRITLEAIEKFVIIQMIILGTLQMLALQFAKEIASTAHCWLRTPSGEIPSEFVTKIAFVNNLRANLSGFAKNTIVRLILERQQTASLPDELKKAA